MEMNDQIKLLKSKFLYLKAKVTQSQMINLKLEKEITEALDLIERESEQRRPNGYISLEEIFKGDLIKKKIIFTAQEECPHEMESRNSKVR